jgi:2,5-dihydroxypyridine 5,6-dioxygenase
MRMPMQAHHIDMFVEVFRLCGVKSGDACAVLSEAATRPDLPQLSMLALQRIGARPFSLVMAGRAVSTPVPVRSTGASDAIAGLAPVVQALAASVFIADCTVEGLQHAAELPQILAGGARVLVGTLPATRRRRSASARCHAAFEIGAPDARDISGRYGLNG